MCLTQDGTGLPHAVQAGRLCSAGARWIQLRMKEGDDDYRLDEARRVAAVCRRHRAILIVNDRIDIAVASGADGVHLGATDVGWEEARRRMGPARILGGTVNNAEDAARAVRCGCLDYAGLGPLRFTATKAKLAPVLSLPGIHALVAALGTIPAWAIGGIVPEDLPLLREAGCAGAAVSSYLHRGGRLERNLARLLSAWVSAPETGFYS
jgi:thiamine-phosphate pyrophosphorylase